MNNVIFRTRITCGFILTLFFFTLLVFSCNKESFGPGEDASFIKFFGGHLLDEGFDVKSLPDGGYLIAGTSEGEPGKKVILIRTDRSGNQLWSPRLYGSGIDSYGYSLQLLPDGGFAIAGSTTRENGEGVVYSNMYLVVTDENGELQWEKEYGGESDEVAYNLQITDDGGFILIGSTSATANGPKNIRLVKTDQNGDTLWTRTHGGENDDVGKFIAETAKGFIYAGYTNSFSQHNQSNSNIFVAKTNSSGRIIYPYTYGASGNDSGKSLIPLDGGGYFILGSAVNPDNGKKNVFLSRVGEDISNVLWTKYYGGDVNHEPSGFRLTANGRLVIAGTKEISSSDHRIFLMETDRNGNQLLFRTYGGKGLQRANAIDLTDEGGYIITGSNRLGGNSMITLIKTLPRGEL